MRHRADLPPELEGVVLKCLQKDPNRRYAAAGELADDLARWRRGESVRPAPLEWVKRTLRRPAVAVGALVLLAAVVIGAVALFWPLRFNRDPDQPLHDGQEQLAHGRAVTLIGESGAPAWSRWAEGGATVAHARREGRRLHLGHAQPSLPGAVPRRPARLPIQRRRSARERPGSRRGGTLLRLDGRRRWGRPRFLQPHLQ